MYEKELWAYYLTSISLVNSRNKTDWNIFTNFKWPYLGEIEASIDEQL